MRSNGPEDTFIAHMMLKYVYSDLSHIMLWVAGGNCATKMCNRIRGERYRGTRLVTLPYLTLPDLILPYLPVPYLTLP